LGDIMDRNELERIIRDKLQEILTTENRRYLYGGSVRSSCASYQRTRGSTFWRRI